MTLTLRPVDRVSLTGERPPTSDDIPKLGALMLDAYRGTIDFEEETLELSVAEVQRTFGGDYGPFMPDCSRIVDELYQRPGFVRGR